MVPALPLTLGQLLDLSVSHFLLGEMGEIVLLLGL